MKNLQKSFEDLLTKYKEQRPHFEHVIEQWKKQNMLDEYHKGEELLQKATVSINKLEHSAHLEKSEYTATFKTFKKTYKQLREITKPVWRQWNDALVVALALAVVFRSFIFGLYHVPTGSAEPTILVGDRIWGNKMAYLFGHKPQRGDSVIFDNPNFKYASTSGLRYLWQRYVGFPSGPDNWVKRVIAIPGDEIEGRIENGTTVIYLNQKKLDEPYVNPYPLIKAKKTVGFYDGENFGPFPVPPFLRSTQKMVTYTLDPAKPLTQQPFYTLTEKEVGVPDPYELIPPFTPSYTYGQDRCVDVFGPYKLSEGEYWVMGDSRKNSQDSRYWLFLDEKLIHGRASFVIYSIDSEEATWLFDLIKHPIVFWTKHVRWNRFFKKI